jgi:hypothetical protein
VSLFTTTTIRHDLGTPFLAGNFLIRKKKIYFYVIFSYQTIINFWLLFCCLFMLFFFFLFALFAYFVFQFFYCLFPFFVCFLLPILPPPSFSPLFCVCFWTPVGFISCLPNLIGTKSLGCYCCKHFINFYICSFMSWKC